MKRVCHLTSVHSSDDTRVFHKECVSLARAGYDVTLVAPGESREEQGVHIVGVGEKPVGTLNRLTSPFVKHAFETALALDCELYHLHDPELLPFALRLKRRGKTVVFDSHEIYALLIQEKGYIPGFLKKPAAASGKRAYSESSTRSSSPARRMGKTRLRSARSAPFFSIIFPTPGAFRRRSRCTWMRKTPSAMSAE